MAGYFGYLIRFHSLNFRGGVTGQAQRVEGANTFHSFVRSDPCFVKLPFKDSQANFLSIRKTAKSKECIEFLVKGPGTDFFVGFPKILWDFKIASF